MASVLGGVGKLTKAGVEVELRSARKTFVVFHKDRE